MSSLVTDRNDMRHKAKVISFLFAACLLLTGCFCASREDWRESRIFCGMTRSDGTVSDAEWEQFCEQYVTAEFPDGCTTLRATGYWKANDAPAAIREDTRVIVVLAPSGAEEKVRRIARRYRQFFQQEAVLIVSSPADVTFELVEASSDEEP